MRAKLIKEELGFERKGIKSTLKVGIGDLVKNAQLYWHPISSMVFNVSKEKLSKHKKIRQQYIVYFPQPNYLATLMFGIVKNGKTELISPEEIELQDDQEIHMMVEWLEETEFNKIFYKPPEKEQDLLSQWIAENFDKLEKNKIQKSRYEI